MDMSLSLEFMCCHLVGGGFSVFKAGTEGPASRITIHEGLAGKVLPGLACHPVTEHSPRGNDSEQ